MVLRIASFDIGKRNFAFYIEEFDPNQIQDLTPISVKQRYEKDGTPSSDFLRILQKIWLNGKCILFRNCDLTQNTLKGSYLDPETFYNMTDVLDEYKSYWDTCSTFVIEQQMGFGKQRNTMALKLGQHCFSYFTFQYGRFKNVVEFPSYHKTQILGAPKLKTKQGRYKAMTKPQRKKWSIEQALQILKEREDQDTLSQLTSQKKKDDLADVLCQLQAFKCLLWYTKST